MPDIFLTDNANDMLGSLPCSATSQQKKETKQEQ